MPLKDMLNLVNSVSVIKTVSTADGMGGITSTSSTTILTYAALWQNGSVNRWLADKYQKNSTHQLVFEYGDYTFNDISALTSTQSMLETVTYSGEIYKTVGYGDDVMELHEIIVQALERQS